jgi:NAD(P)H dehydrogenase (quinone)
LVFGATGAQGGAVARRLIKEGVGVRAVSRDAKRVRDTYGDEVEVTTADLTDGGGLRRAFDGADAAFFHLPVSLDPRLAPDALARVLRAAREANLPRLVFTTGGASFDLMPPIMMVEVLRAATRAVHASGVPATVLRPTVYLENLLQPQNVAGMRERGTLSYPPLQPDRRVSWTALDDQAAFAVAAMTADSATGATFDIASPEPLTGAELAALLSDHVGREVRFTPLAPREFGDLVAKFYGAEAGAAIGELYEATDSLPPDGAVINLEPALAALPVGLTPVSEWVARQKWD